MNINIKTLQNTFFILFIGTSPLLCEYTKSKIDSSSFARQIKNKILLKHNIILKKKQKIVKAQKNKQQQSGGNISYVNTQDDQIDYITMHNVDQAIQFNRAEKKLTVKQKSQLEMIKKWMATQVSITQIPCQKNVAISLLHAIGGIASPNIFFISICSYFVLYQVGFVQQLLGIKNGVKIQNSLTFDKLNNFYLFASGIALGLVGMRFGVQRMTKRAMK